MFSGSSQPRDDESQQEEKPQVSETSPLLKIGTLVVIGAIAANVFGFRYSRWAVGKEIHRGWETHARNVARQAARARAKARAEYSTRGQAQQAEEGRRAEERAKKYERDEQQSKQSRDSTKRAYERWEQTFRDDSGRYERWEETFTNKDGDFRVHVEFDSRFEDMSKGPFGMPEEVLREFLRGAQRGSRRVADDFDAFRYWEEVHGASWQGGRMGNEHSGQTYKGGFNNHARHYAVLGLREGASAGEIKSAYRREAMKWHPDKYRGNDRVGAEKKFRKVKEAYEALK